MTSTPNTGSESNDHSIRTTHTPTLLWQAAVSAFVLLSVALPTSAQASFFNFHFFDKKINITSNQPYQNNNPNSQTIVLPQAAQNIDPNPSKGGIVFETTTDGAALIASEGPDGALADVFSADKKHNKDTGIYIVQKGDTLSEIAKMFDVSINTIRWANDIKKRDSIHTGQELVILPVTGIKYIVKRGGTLRDIVKLEGGDLNEAADFNDLDPDEDLTKGTVVIIPDAELQTAKPIQKSRSKKYTRTRIYTKRNRHGGACIPGYFIRPIHGGVRTQGIHGWNAVDLASKQWTPIYAAASGRVIRAKNSGWNSGYGHYVMILHPNGTRTLYGHAVQVIVTSGQYVSQGQVIAYMGSTGHSTGFHVHFEIRGACNPF